jgi:hypothetical protein
MIILLYVQLFTHAEPQSGNEKININFISHSELVSESNGYKDAETSSA